MNGYTFTPTGWYATFDQSRSPGQILQARVEAWGADGAALVVDTAGGRLVPATTVPGFVELRPCRRLVDVVPASEGWRVHRIDDAGSYNAPVVGFAVSESGEGIPVVAGTLGTETKELSRPSDSLLGPDDADPEDSAMPSLAAARPGV